MRFTSSRVSASRTALSLVGWITAMTIFIAVTCQGSERGGQAYEAALFTKRGAYPQQHNPSQGILPRKLDFGNLGAKRRLTATYRAGSARVGLLHPYLAGTIFTF